MFVFSKVNYPKCQLKGFVLCLYIVINIQRKKLYYNVKNKKIKTFQKINLVNYDRTFS